MQNPDPNQGFNLLVKLFIWLLGFFFPFGIGCGLLFLVKFAAVLAILAIAVFELLAVLRATGSLARSR